MGTNFRKSSPSGIVKSNKDRERLIFIATAGLAFSLVVIFIVVLTAKRDADAKQDQQQIEEAMLPEAIGTVTLYTVDRTIPAGTKLSNVEFRKIYWPRNEVPSGAVRDLVELKRYYAKREIKPSIPLTREDLSRDPVKYSLPLTPGNRAVTIEVDAISGLEGHALPGTRVDIVLTYNSDGNLTSKVIVQNARVLSYGGDQTPVGQRMAISQPMAPKRTITLDVSPQDALKIQTSRQLGRLSLLLRSPDDNTPYRNLEVDKSAIEGNVRKPTKENKACRSGTMKMDGKEYILDCDGNISELLNPNEP
ncbi:MAG: Flp pilus assembly protein CpaB [Bdellovibrionales bacterium]|nr:Flp pilus assembly protein CpaB [Bdellovibrionales bacterium]